MFTPSTCLLILTLAFHSLFLRSFVRSPVDRSRPNRTATTTSAHAQWVVEGGGGGADSVEQWQNYSFRQFESFKQSEWDALNFSRVLLYWFAGWVGLLVAETKRQRTHDTTTTIPDMEIYDDSHLHRHQYSDSARVRRVTNIHSIHIFCNLDFCHTELKLLES